MVGLSGGQAWCKCFLILLPLEKAHGQKTAPLLREQPTFTLWFLLWGLCGTGACVFCWSLILTVYLLSFPGSASAFCCEVSKTECGVLREERTVNLWCGCFTPPVPWVFWFSQLVRFSPELLSWSSDSELHVGESFSLKCALLHILAVNFLCHEVVWAADSILDTIEEIHVLCLGWISSFANFHLLILVHWVSVSSYEWLLSNQREFWWIKHRILVILINKHPPVI